MTTPAKRPDVRKPPKYRLVQGAQLAWGEKSSGNPMQHHRTGVLQQCLIDLPIAEQPAGKKFLHSNRSC
jgi:hypothetical protein